MCNGLEKNQPEMTAVVARSFVCHLYSRRMNNDNIHNF